MVYIRRPLGLGVCGVNASSGCGFSTQQHLKSVLLRTNSQRPSFPVLAVLVLVVAVRHQ